ncbi:hemagglutinin [Microbacterium sp. 2FI]|uniref:hemagglutinin n=1 Tax=Microbacterium sp. 2FI TaxID=2502193 RepID=UPI0020171529|nr:hemagglutinin [Microbacterium sp. 2FI]
MNAPRPNVSPKSLAQRRRAPWLAAVFVAVLTASTLTASSALAADGPFDIDGTVPDVAAEISELTDPTGNVKELGPVNSSTTKIGVIHNDALPTLGLTNPNAQVDLRRAWLGTKQDPITNHDWLYFAWERDSNNGSGFIAYEFMQLAAPAGCAYDTATDAQLIANCNPWKNRRPGDFMILWDQQGNGTDLYLRTWGGTLPNLVLGAPSLLNDAQSDARYSADFFRGEAAVDLTAAIFGGVTKCLSFANTIPSTVTGNSDTADYKDTILKNAPPISNCGSETVTDPSDEAGDPIPDEGISIGDGVVGVKDSAEVSLTGGSAAPDGSVSFWLCKLDGDALCTEGGTSVGSTDLSGANYPATVLSPTAYVTSVGRYCWRAVFSGDAVNGIPGSSDSSETECFTVNPVTPELSTTAGPDAVLGNAVTDEAELSGTATEPADPVINLTGDAGPDADGTITFELRGPDDCDTVAYTSPGVTVSGDGTYDAQATPTVAGDYSWVAVYSGSTNTNGVTHNADCMDGAEDVTVTSVASSISSAQTWIPNDEATVSAPAGGDMDGTVMFAFFASDDCTGEPLYEESVDVAGPSPQDAATSNFGEDAVAVSASGDYSWRVGYDSDNPAQRDFLPGSCHETSSLTIANGGTVEGP